MISTSQVEPEEDIEPFDMIYGLNNLIFND